MRERPDSTKFAFRLVLRTKFTFRETSLSQPISSRKHDFTERSREGRVFQCHGQTSQTFAFVGGWRTTDGLNSYARFAPALFKLRERKLRGRSSGIDPKNIM